MLETMITRHRSIRVTTFREKPRISPLQGMVAVGRWCDSTCSRASSNPCTRTTCKSELEMSLLFEEKRKKERTITRQLDERTDGNRERKKEREEEASRAGSGFHDWLAIAVRSPRLPFRSLTARRERSRDDDSEKVETPMIPRRWSVDHAAR